MCVCKNALWKGPWKNKEATVQGESEDAAVMLAPLHVV